MLLCIITAACITGTVACKSSNTAPQPYVDWPEEPPRANDVLYVVSKTDDTIKMGYYLAGTQPSDLFPYWKEADSLYGTSDSTRESHKWITIAENEVYSD